MSNQFGRLMMRMACTVTGLLFLLNAPPAFAAVTSQVDKSNILNVVSDAGGTIVLTCV